ncbi:MAG: hypothetical protein NXH82_08340 [Rhodobacteraceae bacterium]|nr:hypothetical protein [Paracoccaceae bacterium]
MDLGLIVVLVLAIVIVSVIAGGVALNRTRGTERGSLPGEGDHVIEVNYNSGGGGGSQQISYTIPRDPQKYAQRFVPKGKRK